MVALIWAIAGLALILAEFIIPDFVIFFFGLGALINALLVAVIPGYAGTIPLQIIVWLGLSGLSLFGLRRYLAKWFKGTPFNRERIERADVGNKAVVLEEIRPESPGRIRYHGTTWIASSYDKTFAPGDEVEILNRDGTKFVVTDSIMGRTEIEETDQGPEPPEPKPPEPTG
jgi:membrane protein implicated in regulation of membrane protease activity